MESKAGGKLLLEGRRESPHEWMNCDPAEGQWIRTEELPAGTLNEAWTPAGKDDNDLMRHEAKVTTSCV